MNTDKYKPIWLNADKERLSTNMINRDELPERFKLLIFKNKYYIKGGNKPLYKYLIVEDRGTEGGQQQRQRQQQNNFEDDIPPSSDFPEKEITDEDIPF